MSNLTNTTTAAALLSLAEELNIEVSPTNNYYESNYKSNITNYNKPKNIRAVYDSHKLDGVIKWTSPIQNPDATSREEEFLFLADEKGGDPRELNNIVEVKGVVVNYQQRDELKYFDGEKTHMLCSVIGYKEGDSFVKKLPNVPYGLKYSFQQDVATKKWSVNSTKANPIVENLGLVGYRGEKVTSCADCIKCGLSSEVIPGLGQDGSDKKITCDPRGRLYLAVFEVVVKKKVKPTVKGTEGGMIDTFISYPIKDILDIDGNSLGDFIFLEVPMPKSNIQGRTVKDANGKKDEKWSVQGYENLCRNLTTQFKNEKDPMRNIQFHYVGLSYRKTSAVSQMSQSNFEDLGIASVEQIKTALSEWQIVCPELVAETLDLEPISINDDEAITVASTVETLSPSSIRNITSDITDEEMPF